MKYEIGEYLMVRTYSAGVFAGYFESKDGKEVSLTNARRMWRWAGAKCLSDLAMSGPKWIDDCCFPEPVSHVLLTEVVEILRISPKAKEIIESVPVWKCEDKAE